MVANQLFIRGDVNTVDLVCRHKAFFPLEARANGLHDIAGLAGYRLKFLARELADARYVPFNDVPWHDLLLLIERSGEDCTSSRGCRVWSFSTGKKAGERIVGIGKNTDPTVTIRRPVVALLCY
jgi:hypothetical protein